MTTGNGSSLKWPLEMVLHSNDHWKWFFGGLQESCLVIRWVWWYCNIWHVLFDIEEFDSTLKCHHKFCPSSFTHHKVSSVTWSNTCRDRIPCRYASSSRKLMRTLALAHMVRHTSRILHVRQMRYGQIVVHIQSCPEFLKDNCTLWQSWSLKPSIT
jgi:hypothetical protein